MEYEIRFCKECGRETTHIEGECIDCSFKKGDQELEEKLEKDEEELERARIESMRKPR